VNNCLWDIAETLSSLSLFGYIDPGSGHTFLQLIISGIIGIPAAFGRGIRSFFQKLFRGKPAQNEANKPQTHQ
jgi:hypothetical protein